MQCSWNGSGQGGLSFGDTEHHAISFITSPPYTLFAGGVYVLHSTVDMDGRIDFIDNSAGEFGGEEVHGFVKWGLTSEKTLETGKCVSQMHIAQWLERTHYESTRTTVY